MKLNVEQMCEFLNKHGIKTTMINPADTGYSRTIQFKVYEVDYRIVWFINESTLQIGSGDRPAQIPFKYIYFDTTFPLVKDNKSIGFSYVKNEVKGWFDWEFPYEVFRLPLEL